jgi:hypothetical protein
MAARWTHEFKPYSEEFSLATKKCRKCGATDAHGDPRGKDPQSCPVYARSRIAPAKTKSAQAPKLDGTTDSLAARAHYALRALQAIAHGRPSTWADKALRGGEARQIALQALADLEQPIRPDCHHCDGRGYIPGAVDECPHCIGRGVIDPSKLDWSKP